MFKLIRSGTVLYFIFFVWFSLFVNAQINPVGIRTLPADTSGAITLCSGETIVFTGFGGVDARSYTFLGLRAGTTTVTLRNRGDSSTWSGIAGTDFNDGDYVFIRAYDQTTAGASGNEQYGDSRKIKINVKPLPTATLTSNVANNTFCTGESVSFSALPESTPTQPFTYLFYINNILVQDSNTNELKNRSSLKNNDVVRVEVVSTFGCKSSSSLSMKEITIDTPGAIQFSNTTSDTISLCYNIQPPNLTGQPASINGNAITGDRYQWYNSQDGINWVKIENAHGVHYAPPKLNATTYFSRNIEIKINDKIICEEKSNVLRVVVDQEITGGAISPTTQILCTGESSLDLDVVGSVTGDNPKYQWQISYDGLHYTNVVSNSNFASFRPGVVSTTTYFRRMISTVTGHCSATSNVHKINVINLEPGSISMSASDTICYGEKPETIGEDKPASSNIGDITYQWQASKDNGITWENIPGAIQVGYLPPPLTETTLYQRVVTASFNGFSCSQRSENKVLITVVPDLNAGDIIANQTICLGETPNPLTLRNVNQNIPYAIQWESSTSSRTGFTKIANQRSATLTFSPELAPKINMYYRAVLTSISGCVGYTVPALIAVQPAHELKQVGNAPLNKQSNLCRNGAIVPIVFEYGGKAVDLIFSPGIHTLRGNGLEVNHDPNKKQYTISGAPNLSVDITVKTIGAMGDICKPISKRYKIELVGEPQLPNFVKINEINIWWDGFQIGEYIVCQGTRFTQLEGVFNSKEVDAVTNLDWQLVQPANAGNVDAQGRIEWNPNFFGRARFRVRGQSTCDASQFSPNWSTEFEIEVTQRKDKADDPEPIGDIRIVILSNDFGSEPQCQINAETLPTQFRAGTLTNEVFWTLETTYAGNPQIPSAGSINNAGVVNWNTGFWGTVNIYADPTNCDNVNNPATGTISTTLRKTYTIDIPQADTRNVDIYIPSSGFGSSLPTCPGETNGYQTHFKSNLETTEKLLWSMNNSKAGHIDFNTGVMTWAADFSGFVTIKAEIIKTDGTCNAPFGEMLVEIPEKASLTLTSGNNSNIVATCQQTSINHPITFKVGGAAATVSTTGLPDGITGHFEATAQTTAFTLSGNSNSKDEIYRLYVVDRSYVYTTSSRNESAAFVAEKLSGLLASDPHITASADGTTLTLRGRTAGKKFMATLVRGGHTPGISIAAPVVVAETRILTITGTPTAVPGIYDFNVSAKAANAPCFVATATGTIRITPNAAIVLNSNNASQTLCNGTPITPIVYEIQNATGAFVEPTGAVFTDGLPDGVSGTFADGKFTISGIPEVAVTASTTFNYTVKTNKSASSCEEAVASGFLTILPNLAMTLQSAAYTQNQSLCAGTPMQPVVYSLNAAPNDALQNLTYDLSDLPDGVGGTYESTSRTFVFSGIPQPNPPINETKVYSYSFTIKKCDGASQTVTNTLTIFPTPRLELTSAKGSGQQLICDTDAIDDIVYKIRGATGFQDFEVFPAANWIQEFIRPSENEVLVRAKPNVAFENTKTFTYSLKPKGSPYICNTYPSVTGSITVRPSQRLQLITPDNTNQAVCNNTKIEDIIYEFRGATERVIVSNLPSGVGGDIEFFKQQQQIQLSGANAVPGEAYTIRINQNKYRHTIQVAQSPQQVASALAALINKDPMVTATPDASGLKIMITAVSTGTIIDIESISMRNSNIVLADPELIQTHGRLIIRGTPKINESENPQAFDYVLTTVGTHCKSITASGTLTVKSKAILRLTSATGTDQQVGFTAACDGNEITPIQYTFGGGATRVVFTGLPTGVIPVLTASNTYTISGKVNVGIVETTSYRYTATTAGESCNPQAILQGTIEVNPKPKIDAAYIKENDIKPVSCHGGNDGAITIPLDSPGFDLRIKGGLHHIAQVDHVRLEHNPNVSDVFTIEINKIEYQHAVIPVSVGGPPQTIVQVSQALVDKINNATGNEASAVVATLNASQTIVLTAKEAGTPFTVNAVERAPNSSPSTVSHTTVIANRTSAYSYHWKGPGSFSSSDLSISNLIAGNYTLRVRIGACDDVIETFEVSQPSPIQISTQLCNGTMVARAGGGVAPYTFKLYDQNNVLINTATTNRRKTYTDLIPGTNYILEVLDSQCKIGTKQLINMPFSLIFDASIPVVVKDYCNDEDGDGYIELGGNASGSAFSGGSNDFSYLWKGPNDFVSNTRDIYNLVPGVYTVTVTDEQLGCKTFQTFRIESVDPIIITPSQDALNSLNLKCSEDTDAFIEVDIKGGLGNYSYSWKKDGVVMPRQNTSKITKLGVGTYEFKVSDKLTTGPGASRPPCEVTRTFVVKAPQPVKMTVNSGVVTKTYCPESEEKASFAMQISGGTKPYKVKVTATDGTVKTVTTNQSTITISNLDPTRNGATYTVTLEDAHACAPASSTSATVSFKTVDAISVRPEVQQIDCKNGKLGSIKLRLLSGQIADPKAVQVQWKSATMNLFSTWATNEGKLENIDTPGTYQVIVSQDACELYKESFTLDDINGLLKVTVREVAAGGCNGELGRISLGISGGQIPYAIQWQQFKRVTSQTTTTTTSTSTTNSATTSQWVTLPQYANHAIVTGLEVGTYRAIVSDATDDLSTNGLCISRVTTRNFIIGAAVFELSDFEVDTKNDSCETSLSTIQFSIRNTLPNPAGITYNPVILLNNSDPKEKLKVLGNNTFKIENLEPGDYTLNIKTGIPSNTTGLGNIANSDQCQIVHPFTLDKPEPITFKGETRYATDPCTGTVALKIESSQVTGGTPFIVNNSETYHYIWRYTPDPEIGGSNQQYVGDSITNAAPGTYELVITDSKGCASDPITITVNATSTEQKPFVVTGTLQNLSGTVSGSTTSDLVKALGPTCDSEKANGKIGVKISGGVAPYTITWYKEVVSEATQTQSATTSFVELTEARNTTALNDLSPGKYKLEIKAEVSDCEGDKENERLLTHVEFINVPKTADLLITDGPFIDEDLCKGEPGRLYVEVFNNYEGQLNFYYNGEAIGVDQEVVNKKEGAYTLIVEKPVSLSELVITNSDGCEVRSKIEILDIGDPEFEYTSPSFEANGLILAREEITFKNTSPLPYHRSEWIFGDGSKNKIVYKTGTVSPVRHTYGISGTYFVTLRNYSILGCFEEFTRPIAVGKGYNILVPNVFTPNNDLINDRYRILFSGFKKVEFKIYDHLGNLLYKENTEEADVNNLQGLSLKGWDGHNAPGSPFYVYHFTGYLITDNTEVVHTGSFILLK